jgi:hypothetical protein
MRTLTPLLVIVTGLAISDQPASRAQVEAAKPPACSPAGAAYTRTTLYFGLSHPYGSVSETQWRAFLREQVTPRFPDGLTVWEANGQWRRDDGKIAHERAKILLLVHEDSAAIRPALEAIIASYKQRFYQQSVLWESASVCAAF